MQAHVHWSKLEECSVICTVLRYYVTVEWCMIHCREQQERSTTGERRYGRSAENQCSERYAVEAGSTSSTNEHSDVTVLSLHSLHDQSPSEPASKRSPPVACPAVCLLCSCPTSLTFSLHNTTTKVIGPYDASCSFLLTSSKFSTKSGTSSSSSPPAEAPPAAALACCITACRSGSPPSLAAKDE